jgi:hypothetical protein
MSSLAVKMKNVYVTKREQQNIVPAGDLLVPEALICISC